ncbi:ATPase [Trypanosoma cruzi]|uniref:ATPase n=1 Tax=Trypanosoma cruzi TaxID=5693 RepID=A0A7J6XL18_TRYCR|nr:ATPase [Trypanosoma cruzi]
MCVKFFTFLFLLFFYLSSLFFAFEGNQYGPLFLLFPLLIAFCCTLPVRGAVCFPPNCSTRTPTDTLMTTALCASPAARMRRGRDERRAEGAVTCGRAARACGAEHTFLSLLFCFLFSGQGGQTPAAPHTHSHTLPPCFFCLFISRAGSPVSISLPPDDFFFLLRSLFRWRGATPVMSACFSQSPHTRVTVRCGPHSHADERAEGSSNTQMTP